MKPPPTTGIEALEEWYEAELEYLGALYVRREISPSEFDRRSATLIRAYERAESNLVTESDRTKK
jgi:hypothetical protein